MPPERTCTTASTSASSPRARRGGWAPVVPLVVATLGCPAPAASPMADTHAAEREVTATPTPATGDAHTQAQAGSPPTPADRAAAHKESAARSKETVGRLREAGSDPARSRETRREFLRLLDEGRRLSARGDHLGAIAALRQALHVEPTSAAALGELGWAAFQRGDLELARTSTELAVRYVRSDPQLAMLQYNLGRVAEASDAWPQAVEHYERSLALRDNATVKQRLSALKAEGYARQAARDELGVLAGPFADLEAACVWLRRDGCTSMALDDAEPGASGEDAEGAPVDPCECEAKLYGATPDQQWGMLKAASTAWPQEVSALPVAHTTSGWMVLEAAGYEYNPGAFGISEEMTLLVGEALTVSLPDTQGAILGVTKDRYDSDMGICEIEMESYEVSLVCLMRGDKVACTPPVTSRYSFSREFFPEMCEDEAGQLPEGITASAPITRTFSAHLDYGPDSLVVSDVEGSGEAGWIDGEPLRAPAAGAYPYATLLPSLRPDAAATAAP